MHSGLYDSHWIIYRLGTSNYHIPAKPLRCFSLQLLTCQCAYLPTVLLSLISVRRTENSDLITPLPKKTRIQAKAEAVQVVRVTIRCVIFIAVFRAIFISLSRLISSDMPIDMDIIIIIFIIYGYIAQLVDQVNKRNA
jgi:hypothetical protein